ALEKEIENLENQISPYLYNLQISQKIHSSLQNAGSFDPARFLDSALQAAQIPELKQETARLQQQIKAIDTSTYDLTLAQRQETLLKIRQLEKLHEKSKEEQGSLKSKIETGRDLLAEKQKNLNARILEKEEEGRLHPDAVEEGERRLEQRIARNESREAMVEAFRSTKTRNSREAAKCFDLFEKLKTYFNDTYHLGLQLTDEKDEFAEKLEELETSGLPESQEKLAQFEKETKDEFKQGVLDKIRADIESCRQQIHLLNGFLQKSEFQGRTYSVTLTAHPQHKALYDAIMDRESMEKDPEHWEEIMRAKHGDVLDILYEDLFSSGGMQDPEAAQRMYEDLLDYRNYILVDMKERTVDSSGNVLSASLSRDAKVFSGGEGQLPFYLVILASAMMQYRVGVDHSDNTIRVVFFDEAFSKMSANLIPTSIEMAKRMGLQPVIFMPKLDPELLPSTEYLYYIAKNPPGEQPDILPFAELREYMEPAAYDN
ncbi:MAG: hypothetical protein HUJ54_13735, partial [Erysipelotrichaceae bacterium]|nr:hypothetical protein [Erysipelotrichaceae bacterium]